MLPNTALPGSPERFTKLLPNSAFPGNQGLLSVLLPYTALPYTDIILCLYLVVQNGVTLCREDQLVEPPDLLQVLLPVCSYDQ